MFGARYSRFTFPLKKNNTLLVSNWRIDGSGMMAATNLKRVQTKEIDEGDPKVIAEEVVGEEVEGIGHHNKDALPEEVQMIGTDHVIGFLKERHDVGDGIGKITDQETGVDGE